MTKSYVRLGLINIWQFGIKGKAIGESDIFFHYIPVLGKFNGFTLGFQKRII